jgi:hypothetical protein
MKIFMAGIYHAGRSSPGSASVHTRVTERYIYPFVLESFYYVNTAGKLKAIRHNKQKIFLDSGAFTAFTQGAKISLRSYADFVARNLDIVESAASLDVIGEGREQESYDNLQQLKKMLGSSGKPLIPTHHISDHDDWLKRYLDEGHDFIALGGVAQASKPTLKAWLDHIWHYYLTNPDGTAKIRAHGFAITDRELMFRYPWYSVDSTSWAATSHFGAVFLAIAQEDGSVKDYKIDFSTRSSKRYQLDSWHFNNLTSDEQEVILARLAELEAERVRHPDIEAAFERELGTPLALNNPQALAKSYGARDLVIFEYFKRAMKRGTDRFVRLQPTLWD